MGLLKDAVELAAQHAATNALTGVEEEAGKTLFAKALERIVPTARQQLIHQLFTNLANILTAEYSDHADLVGTAQDDLHQSIAAFLSNPGVRDLLIEPLDPQVPAVNALYLAAAWRELKLTPLPDGFSWALAGQRYLNQVRKAIQRDPDLRDQWKAGVLDEIRTLLARTAPPDHGFRPELYRARIQERYGYLKFDSFHVTGSDVGRIPLNRA